jgi:hypothetical protein
MFKRSIGKQCEGAGCGLAGQLQDAGLVICPECGTDLVNVQVDDKRAQAILAVALSVLGAVGGFVVYGYVARALSPIDFFNVLRGSAEVLSLPESSSSAGWVEARARFYNNQGPLPGVNGEFLVKTTDGRRTATLRDHLEPNTLVSFDVRPAAPDVSAVYFLHTTPGRARVLYVNEQTSGTVSIPGKNAGGKDEGIELVGADTEHFVLIAAKKPIPSLDSLRGKAAGDAVPVADVDAALATLERDANAYVLYIDVPHS